MIARLLTGVVGIGTTAILTRILDPERYGVYGLILVVMNFVASIAFDWFGPSFLRIYQAHRSEPGTFATFVHLFVLVVLVTAVTAAVIWGVGGFTSNYALVYILGLVLAWAYSWFELASSFEMANLRPLRYLQMQLSRAGLILIGATGAAWITHDPLWIAVLIGLGMLGGALLGSFWNEPIGVHYFSPKLALEIVGYGLPVAVGLALLGLVNNGTRALLEFFNSAEGLGLYTATYLLVQTSLVFIASSVAAAGYSIAVQALERGNRALAQQQMSDNGTLLLAVVAPSCLGLALTAQGFTTMMLGRDFRSAALVLAPWMAAASFFASIRAYFFDFAFHLGRRPTLLMWVMVVAAASALGFGILLIPKMGPVGAAVAVTMAMAISCCHSAVVGRRIFRLPIAVGAAVQITLCCGFMALIVLSVPVHGTMGFLLQVFLGALGYGCAAIALNVLDLRNRVMSYLSKSYVSHED